MPSIKYRSGKRVFPIEKQKFVSRKDAPLRWHEEKGMENIGFMVI